VPVRKTESLPSPDAEFRFSLSELLDGRPPGERDSPIRAAWDELKLDISSALMGSPYDPRVFLGLSTEQQRGWPQRQRAFLAAHFRDDPRVRLP
jgi:hypothetical protein